MTDTLERVKTYQQFIGGEFVDAASGETLGGHQPGQRPGHRQGPEERGRGRRPGGQRRRDGVRDVQADDAAGPLADAPEARRPARGQGRRARPAREPERRQAGRRGDRRDGGLRRPLPVLRRRGAGHGRPRRERVPRRPHLDHPARPDRRRRLDRAVELPALHGHVEARAGARHRQHGRPEAVGPDAAHGPRLRRDPRRGVPARRRQRPVGLRRRHRRHARRPSRRSGWSRSPATRSPASGSRRSPPTASSASTSSSAARRR